MNIGLVLSLMEAGEAIAAYYNSLIKNGVPKDAALQLTLAAVNVGTK